MDQLSSAGDLKDKELWHKLRKVKEYRQLSWVNNKIQRETLNLDPSRPEVITRFDRVG